MGFPKNDVPHVLKYPARSISTQLCVNDPVSHVDVEVLGVSQNPVSAHHEFSTAWRTQLCRQFAQLTLEQIWPNLQGQPSAEEWSLLCLDSEHLQPDADSKGATSNQNHVIHAGLKIHSFTRETENRREAKDTMNVPACH